jgi:two-component system phosphate regulon sensor histidine kinase PhoR
MNWYRTLLLCLAVILIALLVQVTTGSSIGWILAACWFAWKWLVRDHHAHQVWTWSKQPESPPPSYAGDWDNIVANLYRHIQQQTRSLQASEQSNQAIMSAAQALPIGVMTLDQRFGIIWFNRTAQALLDVHDQDIGKNLLQLLRAPEFVAYCQQGSWPDGTNIRHTPKGKERTLRVRLVAYAQDQLMMTVRDLTQLEKLETTRRDFVANVSHELRTPLTVLHGFLETLNDAPEGVITKEQHHHYMSLMLEQSARMQALVSDLLTLSNLETAPSADRTPVNMGALIGAAQSQAEAISAGHHTFEWIIDPGLELLGAQSELASAVLNLVTNAVRYTPEGGHITVRWQRDPAGHASYSVTDTGIGIAAEHIPRLSERFYRVDRGRSRDAGGTGLGLAITKHVAMRHDGRMEIQSKLGEGSTFTLVFPPERVAMQTS